MIIITITDIATSRTLMYFSRIQWNLSVMVAHGPEINGCNREVAALKKCLIYGILPIGA